MAMRRAASRLARLASVDPSRAWSAAPRALASVPCSLSRPREFSHKPEQSVYGGPKPASERVTLRKLAGKYRRGERISVVTAYDYPSAVHVRPLPLTSPIPSPSPSLAARPSVVPPRGHPRAPPSRSPPDVRSRGPHPHPSSPLHPSPRDFDAQVDLAGVDVCLVGDSAAMVVHGHDTTLPITLDEMLPTAVPSRERVASPPRRRPPFRLVRKSPSQAVEAATRMLKEGAWTPSNSKAATRASRRRQSRRRRRRGVHGPRRSHPAEHQRFGRIQTPGSNPRRSLGGGGARVGAGEGGMFRHRAGVRPRRAAAAATTAALRVPTHRHRRGRSVPGRCWCTTTCSDSRSTRTTPR